MKELVFCYNCNSTRELKDIKKSEISIRGKCKKCGTIISKKISVKNHYLGTTSQDLNINKDPNKTSIGLSYNEPLIDKSEIKPHLIKMKIFVSYSRRDAGDFANQIDIHLSTFNYDIFTDIHDIRGGDIWSNTIEQNISNCDIFVVIVTSGALYSLHVEREVLQAQRENKKIIPCIYIGIKKDKIKWGVEKFQGVEFSDKYELARLLESKIDVEDKPVDRSPIKLRLFHF
jgi:hypothetical protein